MHIFLLKCYKFSYKLSSPISQFSPTFSLNLSLSLSSFVKCFQDHMSAFPSNYTLFLSSDSLKVAELFQSHFPPSSLLLSFSLLSLSSSLSSSSILLHTDKCLPNCEKAEVAAVLDNFVLSKVDSLLISRSGFSETAAMVFFLS